ncbi:hypothetical protein GCM10017781_28860 [Deinococcus metalli]|uniref:Uncharacterized protein n=1 Tax=Deinococcus metalli TaxID=1141878 RepID=A0ABQ3JR59_9DEIO|nr:hypothetical protein GCM10017781_28860 [Deinococcus metalli]
MAESRLGKAATVRVTFWAWAEPSSRAEARTSVRDFFMVNLQESLKALSEWAVHIAHFELRTGDRRYPLGTVIGSPRSAGSGGGRRQGDGWTRGRSVPG